MKTNLLTLLSIMVLLNFSCKDAAKQPKSEPETIEDVVKDKPDVAKPFCYLYAVNKDSISLHFINTQDKIQGSMKYNFNQIDGSSGTFNGIMKGDTLVGVYNFETEGTKARRELIFLKTANGLVQGTGETELVDNTELFKQNTTFNFMKGRVLKSVDCAN